jgi:hypothetical protein
VLEVGSDLEVYMHCSYDRDSKNINRIVVRKRLSKRSLRIPVGRWENIIKTGLGKQVMRTECG